MNAKGEHLLEAEGLRLRFVWRGDRFAHDVWVLDDGQWMCGLESVEGTAEDLWPPSPPFQSLHIEPRGDKRFVALLVGMAGKSHWSASAAIDPSAPFVHFDVACRLPADCVPQLASSYIQTGRDLLEVETCGEPRLACVESDRELVQVSVPCLADRAVRTIRWEYRLRPIGFVI